MQRQIRIKIRRMIT
jgi:hypothetical protein